MSSSGGLSALRSAAQDPLQATQAEGPATRTLALPRHRALTGHARLLHDVGREAQAAPPEARAVELKFNTHGQLSFVAGVDAFAIR